MKQVNDENITMLRSAGLMTESEVAYVQGDLLIAVNVLDENKRILGKAKEMLTESTNKRVLKG